MSETVHNNAANFWWRPVVCTYVGLAGNILLSAGKLVIGLLAGSAALVADGFHSSADVLSDIGILFALKASSQPPDENHPYGHHSFETLGAIIVAGMMLVTGAMIAWQATNQFISGEFLHPTWPALVATLIAVVVKEVMARYTINVGKFNNSPALLANGAMHRSDAISSLAASAGIFGAMKGWYFLDSVGALLISLFILKMGWDLMRENVMALMDTMPDPELVIAIKEVCQGVGCIQEVLTLNMRQRGSYYLADLRITVHPAHTIEAAHTIAHNLEDEVRRSFPLVASVFVHVEPGDGSEDHSCL